MGALKDKVAAVIGAASGIGKAIATGFGAEGAIVECLDLDLAGATTTAAEIERCGGRAGAGSVDVRRSQSIDSSLADVAHRHRRLDITVATPGINVRKPLLNYTDEEYDAVVDVNLRGPFHVLRAAGRLMVAQRSGSILVISSVSCRVVEPGQVVYAGTKAALAQMVRVLAAELGPFGVRVNAISPGPVETALTGPIRADQAWADAYSSKVALQRWARPAEMAGPAIFLASDAASYVNGEVLFADGGWTDLDRRFQGGSIDEWLVSDSRRPCAGQ